MEGFYRTIKQPFIDTDRTNTPKLIEWCLKLKALKDRDYKALPPEQLKPLVEDFLAGRSDAVYLAYTDFVNLLRQVPRVLPVLPLQPASQGAANE